jgi:ribonuclease HI
MAKEGGPRLVAVYLDFTAAFDRVPLSLVVDGLLARGGELEGDERVRFLKRVRWVKAFLSDRSMRVRWDGEVSEWKGMRVGVPQGTLLGPAGWKIVLRGLQERLRRMGAGQLVYADDVVLLMETSDPGGDAAQQTLQSWIDAVEDWAEGTNMRLSADKTKLMVFGGGEAPKVKVGGKELVKERCATYLGVKIDEDLSFSQHVESLMGRCSRRLAALEKLCSASWRPSCHDILSFHKSLTESVLRYGIGIWGHYISRTNMQDIDAIQADASRCALGMPRKVADELVMAETGLLGLRQMARREASYLVAAGRTREQGEVGDPLEVETEKGSWWAEEGREALSRMRCNKWDFLPEKRVRAEEENDIFSCVERGQLVLDPVTATEEDIVEIHERADTVIYTDGSAKGGYGGAGWTEFRNFEHAYEHARASYESEGAELEMRSDSFLAEQTALLRVALGKLGTARDGEEVVILTDSLSNIMSLASPGNRDAAEAETRRALKRACDRGVKIRVKHCKGHSGILGNDLADEVAGRAMEEAAAKGGSRKVTRRVACRLSALAAKENAKQKWEDLARSGTSVKCRKLAALRLRGGGSIGNPLMRKGSRGLEERRWEVTFNHLRMGRVARVWGDGGRILTRTWKCGCERQVGEESVLHFLFKCPEAAGAREGMRLKVERKEEEEKEEKRRRGAFIRGTAWGKWDMLRRHPGPVMGFVREVLEWPEGEREGAGGGGSRGWGGAII